MANKFVFGQIVKVADGTKVRTVRTSPPASEMIRVDIPDNTQGVVSAVWAGGELYTVALAVQIEGRAIHGFGDFAESELLA